MSRIPWINQAMTAWMAKEPLWISIASCQVISNVPSAILLSRFTGDYRSLLLGVNIGGTGTLIASLASLITFREYTSHNPGKAGKYIAIFSAFNFAFLIVLALFSQFLLK
jgi:Na+/H+ antiporter NhaD/arsenite permease-like protein